MLNRIYYDNKYLLTYNVLNLPATVSGGSAISYTYDAIGRKLKRVSAGVTTDYIDGIQYTAGAIDFIQTEEGIARKNGASYSYEYTLTDHLGNNRLSFDIYSNAAREVQHDNYFPFGKTYNSYTSGTRNNYLYNGKELQSGLEQYDYGARFYDPVIGRWNVVDPLAELNSSSSHYVYGRNNPLIFVDPDGRFDEYYGANGKKIGEDEKGVNGIVRIVTDEKEISKIKSNTKEGKITESSAITSGFSTDKTVLSESLNVLNRTVGLSEEASTVSNDGTINRMTSGSGEPEVINGIKVASVDITIPKGDNNTSIHSHPMDLLKTPNGQEFGVSASKPGPNDPSIFRHFSLNIIVGSLELPHYNSEGDLVKPANGAVFYDRNAKPIGNITKDVLQRIIKP